MPLEEIDWQRAKNLVSNIIAGLVLGTSAIYLLSAELSRQRNVRIQSGIEDLIRRPTEAAEHDLSSNRFAA